MSEDKDDKDFIPKLKITKIKQNPEITGIKKEGDASTIKEEEPNAASTPVKKEPIDEQLCYRF
jgi:hypothetical protein